MGAGRLPERHLGLVPFQEHPEVEQTVLFTREMAEKHLDLSGLQALAGQAPPLLSEASPGPKRSEG